MSLRRFVQVLFGLLILLAVTTALLIAAAANRTRELVEMQRARLKSYQLADMLRQSSDDLTRFARNYVSTGDPKFEQYYRDVLAIRNGDKPLPEHYERVYWDLLIDRGTPPRPDGVAISLLNLMRQAGFSDEELALLRTAEMNSNELVRIEERAIQAARTDRELALRLMNDAAYHHEKARIMEPIDQFLAMVETRTAAELDEFDKKTAVAFWVLQAELIVFLTLVAIAYPIMRRRVLKPVTLLQRQTGAVVQDLERLAGVTTEIAGGDLNQSFSVSATPTHVIHRDEIGQLARDHDSMIGQLQRTGTAIAAITAESKETERALREAMRAAEAATEAKSGFLASMSHEIRTPMHAIMGYSQLLEAEPGFNDQQRRKLQVIRSSGEHLLGIINDILEMSRIEAGHVSLVSQPFDLWSLIDDVQAMFEHLAAEKQIEVVLERNPALVRTLVGDPGKVRQVMINLVGNALKFTDTGRVVLRASSETRAEDCRVRIEVEDTGPGIAIEDQARIFEAFRQADGGARRGGTGLGLAISRNFAQLMGGELTIRSAAGKGSTFTFTFAGTVAPDTEHAALRDRPVTGASNADDSKATSPAALLRSVPPALLAQLAAAARQARVSQILKTAAEIETHDAAAADCVRRLTQDFQYDDLIRAIDEVTGNAK